MLTLTAEHARAVLAADTEDRLLGGTQRRPLQKTAPFYQDLLRAAEGDPDGLATLNFWHSWLERKYPGIFSPEWFSIIQVEVAREEARARDEDPEVQAAPRAQDGEEDAGRADGDDRLPEGAVGTCCGRR